MELLNLPSSANSLGMGILGGLIDANALQTNRILELGCGNIEYNSIFEPTVSRDLAKSGYDITGIDILDNTHENFKSIRMDLSRPRNLRELPEEEFYVVFDENFTGENNCPVLLRKVEQKGMTWGEYLLKLNREICRILINGGIYIRGGFYSEVFQKTQGELVKIRSI